MLKKNTKKIGDAGEDLAADFLTGQGFDIIARNYRTRFGEIDIISEEGDTLVFVEVKAKENDRFGAPGEMITKSKLHKIKLTAEIYLKEYNYDGPWRIDAVLIEDNKPELIKNITL